MKKFIVIYHAPIDAWTQTEDSSPEAMEEGMKAWMDWAARCGDKLVDMGSPLGSGRKLLPGGGFESSDRLVVGYSILQASDLDEATALLEGHPHLDWKDSCEIEIHEALPAPGGQ